MVGKLQKNEKTELVDGGRTRPSRVRTHRMSVLHLSSPSGQRIIHTNTTARGKLRYHPSRGKNCALSLQRSRRPKLTVSVFRHVNENESALRSSQISDKMRSHCTVLVLPGQSVRPIRRLFAMTRWSPVYSTGVNRD